MIDLKTLMVAILKAAWPGGATAPLHGTMKSAALAIPDNNINSIADGSTTPIYAALAMGDSAYPIQSANLTVSLEQETIIARYVNE